jgi:hypothetical protein
MACAYNGTSSNGRKLKTYRRVRKQGAKQLRIICCRFNKTRKEACPGRGSWGTHGPSPKPSMALNGCLPRAPPPSPLIPLRGKREPIPPRSRWQREQPTRHRVTADRLGVGVPPAVVGMQAAQACTRSWKQGSRLHVCVCCACHLSSRPAPTPPCHQPLPAKAPKIHLPCPPPPPLRLLALLSAQ